MGSSSGVDGVISHRMNEIEDAIRDFDFNPADYPRLLQKYHCEAGHLYAAIRRRLRELVGELHAARN